MKRDRYAVGAGSGDLLSPLWRPQAVFPQLSPDAWHALLGQARAAQMLGRLALRLEELGGLQQVPAGPRPYLLSALTLVRRQEQEIRWELAQLSRALATAGLPLVLLKGAAYLAAGLPAAAGRTFADIDILVPRERLAQAEGALFGAGWIPHERDPYNDRYYREWMHELPPLTHIVRGTAVDVHHTITPPTSAFNVEGSGLLAHTVPALTGLSARAVEAEALRGLQVLQPVDMVLHSAVHLFGEGECGHGLRDLLDMHWLIGHFAAADAGFWPQLTARAAELGLGAPLHHALTQLQRLFGLPVPADQAVALAALRPGAWSRWWMPRLLAVALRPMHPSCTRPFEGLARWLLFVRSHALRMPLRLLVPHLLRKWWMAHFPEKPAEGSTAAKADQPAGRIVTPAADPAPQPRA